jgi:predicted O-methyltransferase YrrM
MGRLLTLEGMDVRIKLGRETIHRFHLSHYAEVVPGDFCITVPEAIKRAQPLDMIFSDGDKSVELTRQQFEQSIEAMSRGGFMVFDDIDFNAEIEALWEEFVGHPRVSLCLTFFRRWGLLRVEPIL